jgi:recombination protein RecR
LARLPGLGPRSARRVALHLIRKRESLLAPLAEAMRVAQERLVTCSVCGNVDTRDPCTICADDRRDESALVVGESVGDLWALERAGATRARYHVLGGALSPLDGVSPTDLNLPALVARIAKGGLSELILAVNATVEGQTTAHYIIDLLADYPIKVTRLAHGVPVGGELDYPDGGTLAAAMRQRTAF